MAKKDRKKTATQAARADRHRLYEASVQDTEVDYEFINRTFRKLRDRKPLMLREDFCGTAKMCCEWASRRLDNIAIGVDLDESVLQWGRDHNLSQLKPEQQQRVTLLKDNVLTVSTPPADVVMAMNFSYQTFKDRDTLRGYFMRVKDSLAKDGVFFMDAFGGSEVYNEQVEETKHKGFVYIWDQAKYNPITGDIVCHIHFRFPDGSRLKKAFTYEWRMWSLPELRELLTEAGFSQVDVYWEGTDKKTGEGNGIYKPTLKGEADPAWVCYLVSQK